MYKPKSVSVSQINVLDIIHALNQANEEIVRHCILIGELQAANADFLNRIRMLEEENLKRR